MKSKVYFTDMRALSGTNLPDKLKKLIKKAGIGEIDFNKKMTAVKIHFGEPGNLSFLRPNYAKAVADVVKELGGRPFLTDCNTLYVGRRKDALEHLSTAYENGFNILSTGCHIIIGDGLKGTDDVSVPVKGGEMVKEAKIGRAVMDADVFISLSHFKGHELTGFGGCFKNIGMGCGSRAGKMEQHNSGKPSVDQSVCVGCRVCSKNCAHDAISFPEKRAFIDHTKCVGCGRCLGACNFDAIYNENPKITNATGFKYETVAADDWITSFAITPKANTSINGGTTLQPTSIATYYDVTATYAAKGAQTYTLSADNAVIMNPAVPVYGTEAGQATSYTLQIRVKYADDWTTVVVNSMPIANNG